MLVKTAKSCQKQIIIKKQGGGGDLEIVLLNAHVENTREFSFKIICMCLQEANKRGIIKAILVAKSDNLKIQEARIEGGGGREAKK